LRYGIDDAGNDGKLVHATSPESTILSLNAENLCAEWHSTCKMATEVGAPSL
jgi:hypothetical protein